MVVHVLRWLLPWACVLGLASAMAYAADRELVRAFVPLDEATARAARTDGALREIEIVYLRPDRPASLQICMAQADKITSDVLESWESGDVEQAVRSLCVTRAQHDDRGGTH
jgi:hypothetical protein